MAVANGGKFPAEDEVSARLEKLRDPWGSPLRYQILNSCRARLMSDGPDRKSGSKWDLGLMLDRPPSPGSTDSSWSDKWHPAEPWLLRHRRELGISLGAAEQTDGAGFTRTVFSGGQTRLHGAAYFRFFTWLMLGTAVAFVPYALLYRSKTHLQD